jgi:phage gp29-like protein
VRNLLRRFGFPVKRVGQWLAGAQPKAPAGLEQIIRPEAGLRWRSSTVAYYTPERVEMILRNAMGGDHVAQLELFDLMEDSWPRLSKALNELKRSVCAYEWPLEPWAEDDAPPSDDAKLRAR